MSSKENNISFLGLLYIVKELLDKGFLDYDPDDRNNMILMCGKVNIMSAVSDLFHDKEQLDYILSYALENGINTEKCFSDAKAILKTDQKIMDTEKAETDIPLCMNRPCKKQYYLEIAKAVSKRSTCLKRHYGAVIVKDDEIIATGYNGAPRGEKNCCDRGSCPRMNMPHNSGNYTDCPAVHAEQNAVISAPRRDMIGAVMYLCGEEIDNNTNKLVTITSAVPCPICERIIRNAGITKVISYNKEIQLQTD